jgi:hypothetical protein
MGRQPRPRATDLYPASMATVDAMAVIFAAHFPEIGAQAFRDAGFDGLIRATLTCPAHGSVRGYFARSIQDAMRKLASTAASRSPKRK